eukprot:scaffold2908_cov105-Isochrysis_galbana.AAC.19
MGASASASTSALSSSRGAVRCFRKKGSASGAKRRLEPSVRNSAASRRSGNSTPENRRPRQLPRQSHRPPPARSGRRSSATAAGKEADSVGPSLRRKRARHRAPAACRARH